MPYPNYHAVRIKDPGDFEEDSFRTKELPNSKGVMIIIGKLKGQDSMTVQAYRFPAENYTEEEVKEWLEKNNVKDYSFEPAKKPETSSISLPLLEHSAPADGPIRIKAVATKEGVWRGVYRPKELLKASSKWLRGIPVTLNHPQDGFMDADVAIGQVTDVEYDEQGAKAIVECELYPEKCPPELLRKIESGEPIDVSTGFFAIQEDSPGKWNDQDYSQVEKTLFFDHLAIVPHGTCSAKDGCGIGVQSKPISLNSTSKRGINMTEMNIKDTQNSGYFSGGISTSGSSNQITPQDLTVNPDEKATITNVTFHQAEPMEYVPAPVQIPLLEGFDIGPDGPAPKFGVTDNPEDAKEAILKVFSDFVTSKDSEIQKLKEQLGGIEKTVREEHMAAIKSYGFSDEEMEPYEQMPIEQLKTVVTHMAKLKVQDEKTKFTMPNTVPNEPTKEDINVAYERKLGRKR